VTRRLVAVVASADESPLALAMLEDVVDLVEGMSEVEAVLALRPEAGDAVRDVTWPQMPVVTADTASVLAVIDGVAELGADEVTVVCPDAPDLPALLLGKLHSALTAAQVAVCPDDGGSLVALATVLPVPAWLREADPSLDDVAALSRLRALAPPRTLVVGPGWHRIRTPDDVARLDPGLEGWEATRALLGGQP
jgi:hypothetical protein